MLTISQFDMNSVKTVKNSSVCIISFYNKNFIYEMVGHDIHCI